MQKGLCQGILQKYSNLERVICETGTGLKGKGQGGHTIKAIPA
jgi:hypothetical protein